MIERKIYSNWAFSDNEKEKGQMNIEIVHELKKKYKINQGEDSDIIYEVSHCKYRSKYYIKKCPDSVTLDELALICDNGNLCFGYTGTKKLIEVYED
ncbi:hypothetical protein J6W34_03620 [bacterium]|nr:hypothetical protein [bacterium]